ncbi:MAG: bifunctional riboflavin kinase/FAD synthetase [Bacteroidetes bacterium]|nr:MAG: bifunctional riboflavin kinase/FAD synthetase [Bacteroidota bacterium]
MDVIHNIEMMRYEPRTVLTIGTFDGVHLGHQKILQSAVERAKNLATRSVVVTFDPHPREIVGKGPVEHLSTLDERLGYLEQIGIDETLVIDFTAEFSQTTAVSFYENYLVKKIGVCEVVIGHDHFFGRNREGSIEVLQQIGRKMGFVVTVIPGVSVSGQVVSSSLIRRSLLAGNVELAAAYLGRHYSLKSTVIAGDKRGRQLGFPTANLMYDAAKKLTPALGVYVAKVTDGKQEHFGMLNIGVLPTFKTNGQRQVEVHLLDYEGDLYGATLTVFFLRRLRGEQKFSSIDDLIAQLQQDRRDSVNFVSTLIH